MSVSVDELFQCRCICQGDRCTNEATQEDGLCDWCGTRTDVQLREHPSALWGGPESDHFLGVGGAGQPHALYSCWDPQTERSLA